jgi:hypothetical protein
VSRWWPDALGIALAGDRVAWVRRRAAPARGLLARGVAECAEAARAGDWQPAVDALAGVLAAQAPGVRAVRIALANEFVRFRVVPWQPQLTQAAERLAYAKYLFGTAFGPAAEAWTITLSEPRYGAPGFACAVESALLDALDAVAQRARVRITALQPHLAAAFNRVSRDLPGSGCVFVVGEPRRLCFARIAERRWQAVRWVAAGDDDSSALLAEMDRERLASGSAAAGDVYVWAPERPALATMLGAAGGRRVHAISPRSFAPRAPAVEPVFALALAA